MVSTGGWTPGSGALDEDAELRAATGADEQRCGGGEPEGAGAGDDQHGDGGGEGRGGGVAGDEPEDERGQRQTDDDRDEHGGHPVGESLDVGLAVLGVLDEAGHLGELGVGADAGGLHDQASAGVDRGPDHGVARGDLDGDGLAGEHRGVDGGGALMIVPSVATFSPGRTTKRSPTVS
jgi:hypothetical protein